VGDQEPAAKATISRAQRDDVRAVAGVLGDDPGVPAAAPGDREGDPPRDAGRDRGGEHERAAAELAGVAHERDVHRERQHQHRRRLLGQRHQREDQPERDRPLHAAPDQRVGERGGKDDQHERLARDEEQRDRQRGADHHRERGGDALACGQVRHEQPLDRAGEQREPPDPDQLLRTRVLAEQRERRRAQQVEQRRVHAGADAVGDQAVQPVAMGDERLAQRDHRVEVRRLADVARELDQASTAATVASVEPAIARAGGSSIAAGGASTRSSVATAVIRASLEYQTRRLRAMSSAGYSGTPLPKKLGIKPGHRVLLLGAPQGFELEGVKPVRSLRGEADVILSFHVERADLERRMPALRRAMVQNAGLWIAWPKKASKVETDLTENVVRDLALANALVDNKVAAIDQVWSGLRLVIRVKDRV
jgi:hypothetical protein